MKRILVVTLFLLATLASAEQQPGSQQPASPSSQAPGASRSQPSTRGSDDQAGSQGQASNAPVTQGCLGGSAPKYTITDKAGITYKLNIPPNADTSKLASHVGESVQVAGDVKDTGKAGNASIDVQGIGPGPGKCPATDSKSRQSPPKQ